MKRKTKKSSRPARIQRDKKGFYYVKDGNKKIILKDKNGHLISNINKNTIKIVNKIVTEKIKYRKRKGKKDALTTGKLSDNSPYRSTKPNVPFNIYFPNFANARMNDVDQMADIIRRLEFKNHYGYDPKYKKLESKESKKELILPDKEKEIQRKILYNDDFARKKKILDKLRKEKTTNENLLKTLIHEGAKQRRRQRIEDIDKEVGAIVGNDKDQIFEYARKLFDYAHPMYQEVNKNFNKPMIVDENEESKVPSYVGDLSSISKVEPETLESLYKQVLSEPGVSPKKEIEEQPIPKLETSESEMKQSTQQKDVLSRLPTPIDIYKEYGKKVAKVLRENGIQFDPNTSTVDLEGLLLENRIPRPDYYAGSGNKGLNRPLYDDQIYGLLSPYKDFVGCIMRDELQTLLDDMLIQKKDKFGFIINTDTSKGVGKHWQAVYVDTDDRKEIDFYDSYGDQPSKDVEKILRKFSSHFPYMLKFKINRIKHQTYNSNLCGWHSSGFLERMFRGSSFVDSTDFNHSLPEAIQRQKEMHYKKFNYI